MKIESSETDTKKNSPTMSRKLHQKDVCTRSDESLQHVLQSKTTGKTLVLAVEDDRLKSLLPVKGQQTLFGDHLEFGEDTTLCIEPLSRSHNDPNTHFPTDKTERFHHDDNSYDTVIMFFPKCGYFQRGPPFMDATRIVKKGGNIHAITGIQPEKPPDHDAKYWVPNSDDIELTEITLLRSEDYKTPIIISSFEATTTSVRRPEKTIVTSGKKP